MSWLCSICWGDFFGFWEVGGAILGLGKVLLVWKVEKVEEVDSLAGFAS